MNKPTKLSTLASVQFGFYTKPLERGTVSYLLAKHFDGETYLLNEVDAFLDADEVADSHLLQWGDVLLVGKGNRNFAWAYRDEVGPAVASSIFFVIRVKTDIVNPEYLATLLNAQRYQSLFQQMGAGSNIPSIRKSELGDIAIRLPSLEQQERIAAFNALHVAELELWQRIIEEKRALHQAILHKLTIQ